MTLSGLGMHIGVGFFVFAEFRIRLDQGDPDVRIGQNLRRSGER